MQQALLHTAAAAGADVRRGTRVLAVHPGRERAVVIKGPAGSETVVARLLVAADGRGSAMRKMCSFELNQDPPGNAIAGVLLENVPASAESSICMINRHAARMVIYFPQTDDSGRAYLVSRSSADVRLHGNADFERFINECVVSGLPDGMFKGATQAGPLATFEAAESWVGHPYKNGCALIGDAAATSDPTWGQGLSLTLRDARELRDALLISSDWDRAGHAYAAAHDRYYEAVRTTESWYTRLFFESGPEADVMRARVLPQMATDPSVLPDTLASGPDAAPPTDEHRTKLFGEAAGAWT